MEFFFNELSIHNQFQSKDDFKAAVHQFRRYREVVTEAGLRLYIHRNIFERPTLGSTFRKGIQKYFKRQQVRTLMNWLSKDGFFCRMTPTLILKINLCVIIWRMKKKIAKISQGLPWPSVRFER